MCETLRKQAAGFDNWVITTHEADYMSVFGDTTQDLVYLTGGAPARMHMQNPDQACLWPTPLHASARMQG
jgi:hypothetical protein